MDVLVLSSRDEPVVPALALLGHRVRVVPAVGASLADAGEPDVLLVDARTELAGARALCRLAAGTLGVPVVAVLEESGLVAVSPEWEVADIVLPAAGPAELDVRLRLAAAGGRAGSEEAGSTLVLGELVIDEETYLATVRGRPLDLTYKEFELLKFLVAHVGRVFTRAQLLQEVWGYDFFGGTRTVDVHVRRLRAKLGPDHEVLIGTVRNVGYKAVRSDERRDEGEGA